MKNRKILATKVIKATAKTSIISNIMPVLFAPKKNNYLHCVLELKAQNGMQMAALSSQRCSGPALHAASFTAATVALTTPKL